MPYIRNGPWQRSREVPECPVGKDLDSRCTSVVSFPFGTTGLVYSSLSETNLGSAMRVRRNQNVLIVSLAIVYNINTTSVPAGCIQWDAQGHILVSTEG